MVYRALGLMSGSSLDGLDIAFVEFLETGGKWSFEILQADCTPYNDEWTHRLKTATQLTALDYQLLHTAYGHFLAGAVNDFIDKNNLHFKIGVIGSHGHTTFHLPEQKMTAQLGDGAALAAGTGLPVVSDLRNMDVALGGQGAPIVPIGEQLLWNQYEYLLNIGGIANISINNHQQYTAFDICSANAILNTLANQENKAYDEGGALAASGNIHEGLLQELNALDYYTIPHPKSLANSFGSNTVLPVIQQYGLTTTDALRTYTEHIAVQVSLATVKNPVPHTAAASMLITGGGAFNDFVVELITQKLAVQNINVVVPDSNIVQYKEAVVMALIAVLRWREENNVLSSVTGASRNSVGGALWMGQEG